MDAKNNSGAGGVATANDENLYQAVIIADSYNERFSALCEGTAKDDPSEASDGEAGDGDQAKGADEQPACLIPLLGVPLLGWTLEALSLSNVTSVVIFCGRGADKVKAWVNGTDASATSGTRNAKTSWKGANGSTHSRMQINCLSSTSARSIGDALRQIDQMQILNPKRPFLLIHSPIVGNVDLSELVRRHERLKEADKNVIMSLGIRVGGRPHPESPIMLIDSEASHLLHYQPHSWASKHKSPFSIPSRVILDRKNPSFEIWSGPPPLTPRSSGSGPLDSSGNPIPGYYYTSLDTPSTPGYRDLGIDVCEADVPALFSENFDWLDMRRHLVNGVLTSELLGKKIGVVKIGEKKPNGHLVESDLVASPVPGSQEKGKTKSKKELEEAAAAKAAQQLQTSLAGMGKGTYIERIKDTRTYDQVARDLLRRCVFPLVPESRILSSDEFELRRGGIYVGKDVRLARTAVITGPSLLSPRSTLGPKTAIHRSVLGADNHVGTGSVIRDSYFDDTVKIGSSSSVETGCIVGANVTIGDRVHIGRGVLLAKGVKVGNGVTIPDFARVGLRPYRDGEQGDSFDEIEESTPLPGDDSVGYIWPRINEATEGEGDDDDEDNFGDPYEVPKSRRLADIGRTLSQISVAVSECSTLSHASDDEDDDASIASDAPIMSLGVPSASDFHVEIRGTLERAMVENIAAGNLSIELTTLMLSSNVPMSGPGGGLEEIVRFVMEQIDVEENKTVREIALDARKVWDRWGVVLGNLKAGGEAILLEIQRFSAVDDTESAPFFQAIVHQAYNADVFDSDDIFAWAQTDQARGAVQSAEIGSRYRDLLKSTGPFLKALQEMEDSDEESEEDSDDE